MTDNTPLKRALDEYIRQDYARMHMPGHKGASISPFWELMAYDVTEVEGTDSLFEDDGPLKELEEIFTRLYDTKGTVMSAGGSTLCIQAMLRMVAKKKGRILAGRNIHAAAVNAMALLGLEPVWVYPDRKQEERLIGEISPDAIRNVLEKEKKEGTLDSLCAVYVTSPDYFGVMSDVRSIAQIAHEYGLPLLVDNAHGAHLHFLKEEYHPMQLGADLCCDSLHKTMPALTGAALLHTSDAKYCLQMKGAMTVFGSTSPNYLIMLSMDSTAAFLMQDGAERIQQTVTRCEELRQKAREKGFVLPQHCDPMRLTLPLAGTGWDAQSFRKLLRKHKIMEEYLSDSGCVLLFSPFNREEDFKRTKALLDEVLIQNQPFTAFPIVPSEKVMSLREAFLSPKESVPVEKAEGRIAAQVKITCPPGIPLVMPGERLHKEIIKILKNSGIFVIDVVK